MHVVFKIIKFVLLAFASIVGLFVLAFLIVPHFIRYYDYGINKNKTDLPYPSYFYEDNLQHDFSTVLHTRTGTFNKQYDALIYMQHMDSPVSGALKNTRLSKVIFNTYQSKISSVENITLEHRTPEGRLIPPLKNNLKEFKSCIIGANQICYYEQVYNDSNLPHDMIENVIIDFTANGKKHHISKTYLIERAYHFSFWDILMGV
ncbi:MAG: hypothetical protein H6859_03710 [Rhodospirillales bacterium]|nr:MAG: hypothetical protein H6859_03710 [Rhodospirillales bacterium]